MTAMSGWIAGITHTSLPEPYGSVIDAHLLIPGRSEPCTPPTGWNGTPKAAARRPAVSVAHACSSRTICFFSTARRYQGARPEIAFHRDDSRARLLHAAGAAEDVDVVSGPIA
jgi:hypothetical protein